MDMEEKRIEAIKEKITGKPFCDILKLAETVVFNFGGEVIYEGMERQELSIHVRTSWRLMKDGRIVLGKGDLYVPADEAAGKAAGAVGIGAQCLFDLLVPEINRMLSGALVQDFSVTENGDFTIVFDNGFTLETFVARTSRGEFWKLVDGETGETEYFYEAEMEDEPTWEDFLMGGGYPMM